MNLNTTKLREKSGESNSFLKIPDVAEMLNVRPGTVSSWISRKAGIPHVKIDKIVRFQKCDVEAWVKELEIKLKRWNFEL